eukprot:m.85760 g.85760  ORF g.85760 m.85760 type:complete len:207 (+) comp36465_c0_seq8:55-675(+)
MLDLLVAPERSLGNEQWEIILGMTVCQAIQTLKGQSQSIKGIEIQYCREDPLSLDIVIDLIGNGVKFVFDCISQRLKLIVVYDLNQIKLRYGGTHFNVPDNIPPTYRKIEESFGPTFLGEHDQEYRKLILSFRGISFLFPVDNDYRVQTVQSSDALYHIFSPSCRRQTESSCDKLRSLRKISHASCLVFTYTVEWTGEIQVHLKSL